MVGTGDSRWCELGGTGLSFETWMCCSWKSSDATAVGAAIFGMFSSLEHLIKELFLHTAVTQIELAAVFVSEMEGEEGI